MAVGAQRLTDKQKKKIIADYVQLQNYTKTAKLNGVSDTTVKRLISTAPSEMLKKVEQKKEQNTLEMLDYMDSKKERVQEIIDVYLGVLTDPEKLEGATLQQITTALGTLIDKWTKMDDIKRDSTASAKASDFQTLADLLQHPAPDRNIKDFET